MLNKILEFSAADIDEMADMVNDRATDYVDEWGINPLEEAEEGEDLWESLVSNRLNEAVRVLRALADLRRDLEDAESLGLIPGAHE